MKVFRLHGASNANMTFSLKNEDELYQGDLVTAQDVTRLLWEHPPELILRSAKQNNRLHKGKKLKIPDIGYFTLGSLIFSEKAHNCLQDYFGRFGKFTPFKVEGQVWFNYVVTNILKSVIDKEKSTYSNRGKLITKPAFLVENLPDECEVFKVPETHLVDIYFNDNGSRTILSLIEKFKLEAGDIPLVWEG